MTRFIVRGYGAYSLNIYNESDEVDLYEDDGGFTVQFYPPSIKSDILDEKQKKYIENIYLILYHIENTIDERDSTQCEYDIYDIRMRIKKNKENLNLEVLKDLYSDLMEIDSFVIKLKDDSLFKLEEYREYVRQGTVLKEANVYDFFKEYTNCIFDIIKSVDNNNK